MTDEQLTPTVAAELRDEAQGQLDATVALRRTLHEWPEVGNELPRTRAEVLEALEGLPLDITEHDVDERHHGAAHGGQAGPDDPAPRRHGRPAAARGHRPRVRVRASTAPMHACGHDTHTAMLAGAARLLADRAGELAGRVLFMFQPGEEGHHGARFMLDEGLLDVPALANGTASPVESAFALHITSSLPSGLAHVPRRRGRWRRPTPSASTIIGKGGHASEPHRAVDPIPVACEIVQALQTMVTRTIDVFDPSVVTIARITAGTTDNIIPETASIEGTIRSVSEATRTSVHDDVRRVADGIAAAHGVEARVEIVSRLPRHDQRRRRRRDGARAWPPTSSAPTGWCACPTRSWAPRTSATCSSGCPAR